MAPALADRAGKRLNPAQKIPPEDIAGVQMTVTNHMIVPARHDGRWSRADRRLVHTHHHAWELFCRLGHLDFELEQRLFIGPIGAAPADVAEQTNQPCAARQRALESLADLLKHLVDIRPAAQNR
jgi:hypothetical protein